ncbi:MAG: helix-turn-helix domain-containing protein, partial [Mariprofundus sp.]|nr:helix-turn-helix domain-containing protein [Mariprofundus sp.]
QVQQRMWPGNVRELKNFLERSLIFGDESVEDDLDLTLAEAMRRFERSWAERVIHDCGGDKAAAASRLGIGLSTLYRKLEE